MSESQKKSDLIKRDLRHVWHPCSQMKDYEDFPPLPISHAEGPFLYTADSREIIDAISSWWCKSLGHRHPKIIAAVKDQLDRFEHIITANTCNEYLVELSEKLASLVTPLNRVFYADNGSTAVEIALKMCLQYHTQTGNPEKTNFVALQNGYHGETILTLAAGDCELYSKPYLPLMPRIPKLREIPYCQGPDHDEWEQLSRDDWRHLEKQLENWQVTGLAGIIFEPIVQGAGGMNIYSPELLKHLRKWATENQVLLVADEIMTGFGRTGRMLACEHAGINPDFICLSKGLTAGFSPMSAVLAPEWIYDAFYDDYHTGKAFLHSNTYCGHALGTVAALAAMAVYQDEGIIDQVEEKSCELRSRMQQVADQTGALINVRGVGFITAADLIDPDTGQAFPKGQRRGFQIYQEAVKLGALLRPLGDTIYFLPPLNTPDDTLDRLAEITTQAIKHVISAS